jgi:predicted RNase H-like nuclease (RuvC/YqgF family)
MGNEREEDHELRELRYRNRLLARTSGRQGQAIYALRCQLAEVRALHSKIDRGDLRAYERRLIVQADTILKLEERLAETQAAIKALEEKLAAEGTFGGGISAVFEEETADE